MVLLMKDPTKLKFKEKDYIAKCINRAQIKNNRLFKENNFELMIGKDRLLWDHIYSNLKHTFRNNNKFTVSYIQNYSWRQIYLYNKFEKELYIIMNEKTFRGIIKDNKKQHWILTWESGIFLLYPEEKDDLMYSHVDIKSNEHWDMNGCFSITQDDKYGYIWIVSTQGLYALQKRPGNIINTVDISHISSKLNNIF